jgi:DNA-directed RNA polymerase specialized sigma subunit
MKSIHECGQKGRERFRCAQAGCQECVNGLLFEHRKLVVAVVRKQWLGERAAFADLVQEGNIALWRAILGFDPERGLAFSTYAWRAIERAVWGAIKRAERGEGWSEWVRGEELALVLVEAEEGREQQEALSADGIPVARATSGDCQCPLWTGERAGADAGGGGPTL